MQEPGQHYLAVINDPTWRAKYVEAIAARLDQFDVGQIQGWVVSWSAQIADAVAQDPHKAATVAQFNTAIAKAHGEVADRADFVRSWVACGQGGQVQTDADGDGIPVRRLQRRQRERASGSPGDLRKQPRRQLRRCDRRGMSGQ
jgi:hypothetical protein